MHKTFLNAKPNCGLHDFTLQSLQYITSIIEAGNDSSEAQEPTNEGWKKEGILSRPVERTWDRNGIKVTIWFYSRWVTPEQTSGIWCTEVNSWQISRSEQQLALLHIPGDPEYLISALHLTQFNHHRHKFGFEKFILSHTYTTLAAFVHISLSSGTPTKPKKVQIGLRVTGYNCE